MERKESFYPLMKAHWLRKFDHMKIKFNFEDKEFYNIIIVHHGVIIKKELGHVTIIILHRSSVVYHIGVIVSKEPVQYKLLKEP